MRLQEKIARIQGYWVILGKHTVYKKEQNRKEDNGNNFHRIAKNLHDDVYVVTRNQTQEILSCNARNITNLMK